MTKPSGSTPQPKVFDQVWKFIVDPKNRPVVMVAGAIITAVLIGGVIIKSNVTVTGAPCGQTSVGNASGISIHCGALPSSPQTKP